VKIEVGDVYDGPEIAGKECCLAVFIKIVVSLVSVFIGVQKRVAASVDARFNVADRVDDAELGVYLSIGFVLPWMSGNHCDLALHA